MTLQAEAITVIRQWIGDTPTDDALQALWEVYASHDDIVIHILNKRLADLSLEPSSLSVPGLSVSHGSDLQALQLLLKNFIAAGGTGLDAVVKDYGLAIQTIRRDYPR